jgi:hypothetical protein
MIPESSVLCYRAAPSPVVLGADVAVLSVVVMTLFTP